jgi:hypothetical protein
MFLSASCVTASAGTHTFSAFRLLVGPSASPFSAFRFAAFVGLTSPGSKTSSGSMKLQNQRKDADQVSMVVKPGGPSTYFRT